MPTTQIRLDSAAAGGSRAFDRLAQWLQASVTRKLAVALTLALVLASTCFLVLFVTLYRSALTRERAEASLQITRLFQVALENAMLKRDLAGLQDIVKRLGQQPGVRAVMIANPQGEVRFADDDSRLGMTITPEAAGCRDCASLAALPGPLHFAERIAGQSSLRSVNPIRNRAPCAECHGSAQASPLNGVLVVDQESSGIERDALRGAALLSGAGILVVLASVMATAWFVRRNVLMPLGSLSEASLKLADDPKAMRVDVASSDEIGQLARSFNTMADRIGNAMSELENNRDFLQSVLDTLPDGLRIIDTDYNVVLDNTAYRAQSGMPDSQTGKPCWQAHGQTGPCPATLFNCPIVELAESEGPVKYLHRHRRPDGTELVAELLSAAVTVERHGAPRRLIVELFRDLSQQVRYSQEQRLAEIGQLATGVAHEIRNPLASVKLGLQAMLRNLDAGKLDTDGLRRYLDLVDGEVEKCIEVTGRLLRLGMPPSEHVQLLFLDRIVREVMSLLAWEAEARKVALEIDMPENALRVLATDSELRMLALNLAQNAFHAMPEGGRLSVCGREANGSVVLEVQDTGVGIPASAQARIFDPFYSRRADNEQGTGLGLTICKAIATRYHGTIEVSSMPGAGSTFTVSLPVAAVEEKA